MTVHPHNARVPRFIHIFSALILLAAGCRAPRYNSHDQAGSASNEEMLSESEQPAPEPPEHEPAEPSAHETPPPAASPAPTPQIRVSAPWVAITDWTRAHQLEPPQIVSRGTNPVFEVRSENGVLTFQTRTRNARFDGMSLLLGFEPNVFGGELWLHELDMERNIAPLLLQHSLEEAGPGVIVIDPGHGGSSTGTRSANGKLEKDYTLDWALRLQPLLETNGWTVLLTRTNDSEMTLPERVAFTEAARADVFVSLHFNASGGGNHQAGLETYCLTPRGMPSNLTRGFEDDLTVEYPNNVFDAENLQLAVRLHRSLLGVNGGEDRGIRRARFMGVLRGQNRPAVLVEGGFLSNPDEAARIEDPEYRQKLAEAVAEGLGE